MPRSSTDLSRAQLDALRLIAHGLTSREAGRILGITEQSVHMRLKSAARTLGARNRTHAVVIAARLGLLDLNANYAPSARREAA